MIWLAGDTHGDIDLQKIEDYFESLEGYMSVTKNDYVIILGDAGAVWDDGITDEIVQSALQALPCTVLFVDGNHENFDILEQYPGGRWHGGCVHFIKGDIIHLMRGQVYEIEGKTFFTFGGAGSIDKYMRAPHETWWPQEIPSAEEYDEGIRNLERHDYKVDYILTHTCPATVARQLSCGIMNPDELELNRYLEKIAERATYEEWFFGHWHKDERIGRFSCLWNEIVELGERSCSECRGDFRRN